RARDQLGDGRVGARAAHGGDAADQPGEEDDAERHVRRHEAGTDEDAGADHGADVDADPGQEAQPRRRRSRLFGCWAHLMHTTYPMAHAFALLIGLFSAISAARSPLVPKEPLNGGVHWKIKTDIGFIHVWHPKGYEPRSAATIVYVHGYYTDADTAWT